MICLDQYETTDDLVSLSELGIRLTKKCNQVSNCLLQNGFLNCLCTSFETYALLISPGKFDHCACLFLLETGIRIYARPENERNSQNIVIS